MTSTSFVFTELANTIKCGGGLSDVTAFHRMKYGGGGCYITLFSPSDLIAFHRIICSVCILG